MLVSASAYFVSCAVDAVEMNWIYTNILKLFFSSESTIHFSIQYAFQCILLELLDVYISRRITKGKHISVNTPVMNNSNLESFVSLILPNYLDWRKLVLDTICLVVLSTTCIRV